MTADIYRLGLDRVAAGESTVVFKVRPDGVIELVANYWKPACDFGDQSRPTPPLPDRLETR